LYGKEKKEAYTFEEPGQFNVKKGSEVHLERTNVNSD
jgi:hypothetical protein